MTNISQQEWKPIDFLPVYLTLLRGMLDSNQEQFDVLSKARQKPGVLDDPTIQRFLKLFTEQKEFFWVWEGQIERWSQLNLDAFHHSMLKELKDDLREIKILNAKILDLVHELEPHTIDRILAKDDGELAMEFLSNPGQDPEFPDEIEETIKDTIYRMAEFEKKYQTQKEILGGIFARLAPQFPLGVGEACGRKLGVKVSQLQDPALRSMLLDYCLFHYENGGKALAAEFMDQCIPHLSNAETLALHDFQQAKFAVLDVKAILMGNGIAVYDLLDDEMMILFDEELVEGVEPGHLIICHLVRSSGIQFTTGTAIVVEDNTHCGRLIRQEISETKNNLQNYDPKNHVTKILQIAYQNI